MAKKILNFEEIKNVDDLKIELVDVPEWGGSVYVRSFAGKQRDQFDSDNTEVDDDGNISFNGDNYHARLAALSICDEKGKLLFTDHSVLAGKNSSALARVVAVAKRLSGLGKEAREAAGKNLKGQS